MNSAAQVRLDGKSPTLPMNLKPIRWLPRLFCNPLSRTDANLEKANTVITWNRENTAKVDRYLIKALRWAALIDKYNKTSRDGPHHFDPDMSRRQIAEMYFMAGMYERGLQAVGQITSTGQRTYPLARELERTLDPNLRLERSVRQERISTLLKAIMGNATQKRLIMGNEKMDDAALQEERLVLDNLYHVLKRSMSVPDKFQNEENTSEPWKYLRIDEASYSLLASAAAYLLAAAMPKAKVQAFLIDPAWDAEIVARHLCRNAEQIASQAYKTSSFRLNPDGNTISIQGQLNLENEAFQSCLLIAEHLMNSSLDHAVLLLKDMATLTDSSDQESHTKASKFVEIAKALSKPKHLSASSQATRTLIALNVLSRSSEIIRADMHNTDFDKDVSLCVLVEIATMQKELGDSGRAMQTTLDIAVEILSAMAPISSQKKTLVELGKLAAYLDGSNTNQFAGFYADAVKEDVASFPF